MEDVQSTVRVVGDTDRFYRNVVSLLEPLSLRNVSDSDVVVDVLCDLTQGFQDRSVQEDGARFHLHPDAPRNPAQVWAGLGAILRRIRGQPLSLRLRKGVLKCEEYTFNTPQTEVAMSTLEMRLILYLLEQGGRPVPRDELLVEVWGYRAGMATRAIDQTVNRIRSKIERDRANPEHLQTIRGQGYRFLVLRGPEPEVGSPSALSDASASHVLHNLPRTFDSFVGREEILVAVEQRLENSKRLVTLHGEPGIGKTRIMVELGRRVVRNSTEYGAIWLIDFSEARTEDQSYMAIANQIQLLAEESAHSLLKERVIRSINGYDAPLILADQCDEALPSSSQVLSNLLCRCPALRVVSTSREPLQLRGESLMRVGSLSTAEVDVLFQQRSRAPCVSSSKEMTVHVATLLERLEGNPLAIELAAARLQIMSPVDIMDRLDDPMRLLRVHRSGAASPHLSMWHALQQSWNRLSLNEQFVFMQAALLPLSFSLEAAEKYIALTDDGPWWEVGHVLQTLVQRSLLRMDRTEFHPYRTLSMSFFGRAFARVKMMERPEIRLKSGVEERDLNGLSPLQATGT